MSKKPRKYASGNVTSTTLKSDTGSFGKTPKSSAAYTSNNNLVESVTDTANQKESCVYGTKQSVMTGQATAVSDAMGNTTTTTYDSKGRVTKKDLASKESLVYTYTEGILSGVTRKNAAVNPLRYRSYYHDPETGFYYLQSRYYDPEICRFISADSYASTGQSYLGYNSFAYCGNDPVNRTDADGEFWDTVFDIVSLGFSIADVIQNPSDPWAWAGLIGDVVDLVPFVTGVGELTKAAGAVADVADVIDDVHDTARALDNIEDAVDTGGDIARKADFYVTPTGEAIPASKAGFEENLSKLELKDGKYYGSDSQGPIRVRSNEVHIDDPSYTGPKNPVHVQPHFHIDRRRKGRTGPWGEVYTGLMEMLY